MKKLTILLIIVLMVISANTALASLDWMDPALCVAGQWLVVNAADESAVEIRLPEGTPFGSAGNCTEPAPAPPFVTNVVTEKGGGNQVTVTITDPSQASTPSVTVTYGSATQTRDNSGKGQIKFKFSLGNDD
jgi:hypothetical protein